MATVQEPRAGNRFEAFVESELSRARRRIQAQDIGAAALGLLAGTLAYALSMVLLDRWLHLSDGVRQVGLVGYLAAAVSYAAIVLNRPFRRDVNPYFAARRVERAVPGAKNSVVSWLDLHAEPLPASIKAAVSQKAAADIKTADVDEVIRDRRLPWIGSFAGGLFVAGLILFFLLRPTQFLSLLSRTFSPFGSTAIAKQTTIELLQPAGGDLTVPVNAAVDFKVEVHGRVPDPAAADAVRLRFRYSSSDPVWEDIPLDQSPREPREFGLRLPAGRIQNGFVYLIAGGDAATAEYRVQVRSSPLIEGFEVGYHFLPYLHFRDQTATNPNIESLRGTQVTLTARTNRTILRGELTFHGRDGRKTLPPVPAEAVSNQPMSLQFRFVLSEDATYTIRFWSVDGEDNGEPIPYTIKVLTDHPPQVEVTQPAPDTLPVNGTITVEGKASDDFGITKMRLCLRLADGERPTEIAPKPYRPGKVFKFADDTFPRALDYKDFLPLDQLKSPLGTPIPLKLGTVIEYWLEAEDNCDNPKPNIGKSRVYKVTLADPQDPKEKRDGEKKAAGDKAQQDQKQDQDLNQQNEAKKQAGDKGDQAEPNGDKPNDQPKEGDPQNKVDGDQPSNPKDQATIDQARRIQEKMNRAREQGDKGEAKGAPNQQPDQPPNDPGQPKGDRNEGNPQNQTSNPAGQSKNKKGEGKGDNQAGQPQPNGDKGESKTDNPPDPGAVKSSQPQQADGQGGNPNSRDQTNPKGGQSDSKQPDQKRPNPNGAGAQQPKPGNQADSKQPDQKQPNPNGAGAQQPKPGNQADSKQPDQKQPNPNGAGAQQPKPGNQADSKQPDQKQPNPNGAGAQQPKPGNQADSKQPDQKQPNPNGAGAQQPKPGNQADSKQPDQKQPNGAGASQPKPKGAGDSGQPDNKQSANTGDKNNQPQGQPNPGDAKSQGGSTDPGEKKNQPQPNAQPGEGKAKSQKSGAEKPGDPKGGGTPGDKPKDNNAGHPNGTTQNQPPMGDNSSKPTTGDRTSSDNPKKDPDGNNGQQKQGSGAGAQSGNKNQGGEPSGAGPKKDPNNQEPTGQPNPMDPGRDGAGSNTGSGKTGGQPKDPKGQNAPSVEGRGGAPDPGEVKPKNTPAAGQEKGQIKPAGDAAEKNLGQPTGKPTGQGELTDAPKGGNEQPGAAPTAQPKTEGAESKGPPSGNKPSDQSSSKSDLEKLADDLKSSNPQTRQAAENRVKQVAKELAKQANSQKPADPQAVQAAEAKAKEALKQLDKDPAGRQALENALKSAAEQASKEELQKLAQDLKSGDAKTRDAAKERAQQLAHGDLKPLADDVNSGDAQRQQKADDFVKQNGEPDPQARQELLDALKGDGTSPPQQSDKKPNGQAKQEFNGARPDEGPLTAPPPEAGATPNGKYAKSTSDLQLERFPKNPSKELLQDLGMTEEQYRQFLKAAAELKKKREAEAKHNADRGSAVGASAANSAVKRIEGGKDKANKLERGGVSLPPEEYRDGYKGFTEDVSKTGGGKKE